jgi:16S rRNA G1207 methylase RsmC
MTADHYFITPTGPEERRRIQARIWARDYEFTTANGVFSAERLDLATGVLLRTIDPPTEEITRVADLGCGWGPIAVALAVECPWLRVDAIDVNERALALTRLNAAAYGVADRVRTLTPDQVEPDATYDEIWSNPPIRIGKDALHTLLLDWLDRLTPQGRAVLVVGRNLGADSLQRWLDEHGWDTERIASAKGFRVFSSTRALPPGTDEVPQDDESD